MKHRESLLRVLSVSTAVITILIQLLWPELAEQLKYPALVLCLVLIGIPHGSIDHIVTARVYNLRYNIRDQLPFYLYYFLMMVAMALIWMMSPFAGLLLFLGLTIYHFGQADLELLDLNPVIKRALFLSRGAMIMGLVLFSDTSYTGPVVLDLTGSGFLSSEFVVENNHLINWFFVLQYLLLQSVILLISNRVQSPQKAIITGDSVLLGVLFWVVNPILAFAVYFGLWHSLGHVKEMQDFFEKTGNAMTLKSFFIKSTPLTIITFLGMGLIYLLIKSVSFELSIVSLLFIIISVLTLPHMLIVEKMYAVKRRGL